MFRDMVIFLRRVVVSDSPKPQSGGPTLVGFRDSLLNVFAVTLHIRRPFLHLQPEDAPCHGEGDPLIMVNPFTQFNNSVRKAKCVGT
jgi:hypothetical protein